MISNKVLNSSSSFMVSFHVFATHQSRTSLTAPSLFLPSSHSSLFFSGDCALFFTTAVSQPFAYQLLPHSFRHDGECTPSHTFFITLTSFLRKIRYCKPFVFSLMPTLPSSVSHIPFACHSYENAGVVVSLTKIFSESLEVVAKNLKFCLHFVSLSRALCSLFALFAPRAFHNSFPFKGIRTLSKNWRGGMGIPNKNLQELLEGSSHFGTSSLRAKPRSHSPLPSHGHPALPGGAHSGVN
jgi:hypothetical protein